MSLYTLRTGATAHPEDSVLQFITDLIAVSGVVSKLAGTTHFVVQAQGTPDMTVKVKSGRAYIKGSSGNGYPIISDADTSVAIGSNGSGSTRIDAVVLYVDKSVSANSDASNVVKLAVVQGTTSAPSDGTIQSSIGASNPFLRLADVTVTSGATSIVSGNITDQRITTKFQFSDLTIQDGAPLWGGWIAAAETWTYAAADAPTFTFTISGDQTGKYSPGMRIKLTQTTAKYFIITAVAYSAPNTTITVYGGTDYTLANAVITSPFYSTQKAPFGFPLDPVKWSQSGLNVSEQAQASPTSNVWYNIGGLSITLPIGAWNVSYHTIVGIGGHGICNVSLSTSNNSESDVEMTSTQYETNSAGSVDFYLDHTRSKPITVATKTTHYLIARTPNSGIGTMRFNSPPGSSTILRAVCAYL